MYTRFFGLSRLPFEASPDPSFLFDGPGHREAIASIEYAVATRMGFITLTGEVGLGKTTVIRAFLDRYDRDRLLPIYVFHPLLSFDELLELVSDELGLTVEPGIGSFNRLRAIQRELIRLHDGQQQVILVIDEAQRLPEDTLENLRLLTNLETNQAKLLQIVLVGQPELDAVLAQPHLRQLDQRIALKARLGSLTPEDSVRYLRHRLTLAGADAPEDVLSPGALRAIVDLAQGVPRRMNILTNRTLIDAFGAAERPVTAGRVRRVANGFGTPGSAGPSRWLMSAAGVLALVAVAAGTASLWRAGQISAWFGVVPHTAQEPRDAMAFSGAHARAAPETPGARQPSTLPTLASMTTVTVPQSAGLAALLDQPAPALKPASEEIGRAAQPSSDLPRVPAPAAVRSTSDPSVDPALPVPGSAEPKESSSPAAPPEQPSAVPNDTPYLVVPGDTLWKICLKAYGPIVAPAMVSKVMSRNKVISDVRLLYGRTIILPSPKNS